MNALKIIAAPLLSTFISFLQIAWIQVSLIWHFAWTNHSFIFTVNRFSRETEHRVIWTRISEHYRDFQRGKAIHETGRNYDKFNGFIGEIQFIILSKTDRHSSSCKLSIFVILNLNFRRKECFCIVLLLIFKTIWTAILKQITPTDLCDSWKVWMSLTKGKAAGS